MITSKAFTEKFDALKELNLGIRQVAPKKEPIFSVDLNTRKITVPADFKNLLAVKGDTNCETIWFVLERYFDGVDLSTKTWGVQFTNAKKEVGLLNAEITTTSRGESIASLIPYYSGWDSTQATPDVSQTLVLNWPIPYELTKEAGTVSISLKCFEADSEAKIIYRLSTEPVSFQIKDSPSVDNFSDNTLPPAHKLEIIAQQIEDVWNDYQKGINIDYDDLDNRPTINNVLLTKNNTTKDLNISHDDLNNIPTINDVSLKKGLSSSQLQIPYAHLIDKPKITVDGNVYTIGEDEIEVTKVIVDEVLDEHSVNPVQNKEVYAEIKNAIAEANRYTDDELDNFKITVDSELNETSTNPVQNKIIYTELDAIKKELAELTYIPLSILTFENNIKYAEKNSTINEVIFNWKLSKTPNALKIDENIVENLQEGSYTLTTPLTDSKEFTLTATDKGNNITKTTEIIFAYKVFYGAGAEIFDDSLINSLTGNIQTTYKTNGEISVTAGNNEYIYYIVPQEYGLTKDSIRVGGFNGGLTKQKNIINYNGITYDVWRSDYANLGTTNIEII